jgi:hypothetical protein
MSRRSPTSARGHTHLVRNEPLPRLVAPLRARKRAVGARRCGIKANRPLDRALAGPAVAPGGVVRGSFNALHKRWRSCLIMVSFRSIAWLGAKAHADVSNRLSPVNCQDLIVLLLTAGQLQ